MQILIEMIEGSAYADIIVSAKELERMKYGEMVDGHSMLGKKRCFVGVRMRNVWEDDYEEESWEE
jgi:hypothetical protein